MIDDLVTCKSTISRCSLEQHPLTSIFQFYQDIRGYVTDLRDCLNEKVGSNATLQYYSMESLGGWLGRGAIGKGKLWVNLKHIINIVLTFVWERGTASCTSFIRHLSGLGGGGEGGRLVKCLVS